VTCCLSRRHQWRAEVGWCSRANWGRRDERVARIALTYVQSHASELGIDEQVFDGREFHVQYPPGLFPKDGPSAGITMLQRSLVTDGKACKSTIGMTGEVHCKASPADRRPETESDGSQAAGLTEVIFPEATNLTWTICFRCARTHAIPPVHSIDEVLSLALEPSEVAMIAWSNPTCSGGL